MKRLHSNIKMTMVFHRFPILFVFLLLLSSCNYPSEELRETNDRGSRVEITQASQEANETQTEGTRIESDSSELQPEDVSIEVKIPLVSAVEKRVLPAEILENETDKPGRLHPRCVAVDFKGNYLNGGNEEKAWYPAQIRICPIAEYAKVYEKSSGYFDAFKDNIKKLRGILLTKPYRLSNQFEIVENLDGSPQFSVNLNFVSFKNGEGFFVITQLAMETTVINNRELLYLFQGLTPDEKYYVIGTFPVTSKYLPETYETKDIIMDGDEHDEYIVKVKKLLKDKSSFTPRLEQIEETVKSLEIRQPNVSPTKTIIK